LYPLIIVMICTFKTFLSGDGGDVCVRFSHSSGGIKSIRFNAIFSISIIINKWSYSTRQYACKKGHYETAFLN
jgi:hypothetical protein